MKVTVEFFEIPAADFDRAVTFYEGLFGITLQRMDCGHEKMACFPAGDGRSPGAVSWTSEFDFKPSGQGILVSLGCEDMDHAVQKVTELGGRILIPPTKIEDVNRGRFSVFLDCEGNRVGLYSDR